MRTSKKLAILERVAMGGEMLLFSIWESKEVENPVSLATSCRVSFLALRNSLILPPMLYSCTETSEIRTPGTAKTPNSFILLQNHNEGSLPSILVYVKYFIYDKDANRIFYSH